MSGPALIQNHQDTGHVQVHFQPLCDTGKNPDMPNLIKRPLPPGKESILAQPLLPHRRGNQQGRRKFLDHQDLGSIPTHPEAPTSPLWVSPKSILLIDRRAYLRRNPRHNRNISVGLAKAVRKYLMVKYLIRAEETATAIGACLEPSARETDPSGAYAILKRWYWQAYAREPNPYQTHMEKVRGSL